MPTPSMRRLSRKLVCLNGAVLSEDSPLGNVDDHHGRAIHRQSLLSVSLLIAGPPVDPTGLAFHSMAAGVYGTFVFRQGGLLTQILNMRKS